MPMLDVLSSWLSRSKHPRQLSVDQRSDALSLAAGLFKFAHDLRGFPSPRERLQSELLDLALKTPEGIWLRRVALHAAGAKEVLSAPPMALRRPLASELSAFFDQLRAGVALEAESPVLSMWSESMNRARDAGLLIWPNPESIAGSEQRELSDWIVAGLAKKSAGGRL